MLNAAKIATTLFCTLILARPVGAESQDPFTLVVLPDTQYYTTAGRAGTPEMFTAQTAWIAENVEGLNIQFVLHEGDITDSNDTASWLNAVFSLSLLDGVVPYALAVGNHDGLGTTVGNTTGFNTHFPVSEYENLSTFGGIFETSKLDNCYHLFSAGGVDWLILALEFGPRDVVLAWADGVIASHPDRRVIVVTHAHVYYDDRLHGSLDSHSARPIESYGRENNGDDVWQEILQPHANVAFVFNGHVVGDGQGRVVSTGDLGNSVYQMLANYQMKPGGGFGFLRLIRLYPAYDRLQATSYSPYLDEYWLGGQQQFVYDGLGMFTDESAPKLIAYAAPTPTELRLTFDEPLDPSRAVDLQNYELAFDVLAASLNADEQTVVLTTSQLSP